MAQEMLLVNWEKCTGCRMCELVCSLEHEGFCMPGHARLRVIKDEEKGIDFPLVCRHCDDAPCRSACPTGALYAEENGVVLWKKEKCIGCGLCFVACPVGAIFFDPYGAGIKKCDMCGGDPQCAKFCDTRAIELVKREDAFLQAGAKMMDILSMEKPRHKLDLKRLGKGDVSV